MLKKFALLLVIAMPSTALAEQVELRSADGFITVEGEVVGYNGRMLIIETSVGRMSVPAAEVGCYGAACAELVSANDFGLTADDIQGVFTGEETTSADVDTPTDTTAQANNLTVALADPALGGLYQKLIAAFASQPSTIADVSIPGMVSLRNEAGTDTAELIVTDTNDADIRIAPITLAGAGEMQYPSSSDWALATQPTHQLLGLNALAVIVPGNVTVDSISIAELAGIYAGEITNWSQLGGADSRILPLQLPAEASARQDLMSVVMAPNGKTIADTVLTMADEKSISASINQFPGSIGVIGLDGLKDNTTLSVTGFCDVPVAPTEFNIIAGDYPLIRPVAAIYAQPADLPLVREMFDFAATKSAQNLFALDGYLSQAAVMQGESEKNARLNGLLTDSFSDVERSAASQMFQKLFPADRLSPTMYGGPTSGPEGAWNRAMFNQLVDLLKSPDNAGRNVLFVGYAESEDGSEAAVELSREAAVAMSAAFAQFATDTVANNDLKVSSLGFGSIAPASCYSGQVDSNAYSRVEVWVQ